MNIPNHKIFFLEEFFGSRIYNTKSQEEYFFDQKLTDGIKKIFFEDGKDDEKLNQIKTDLLQKDLITSDITCIKNEKSTGLTSPLKISLNISRKCNLRCRHCLSDSGSCSQNELTTKEYFDLIDQMREVGTFFITIGGGEPLLRGDLFEIIQHARENFIAVSFVTNGLLLTEEIAKRLNTLHLDTITISLDGLEKNHDYIRGKGNFAKTVEGIKVLRKHCTTAKLAIRVTVNSLNINECPKLIKFAEELLVDSIRLTPILLLGRAKINQELLLSQDEHIRFLEEAQNVESTIKVILPHQRDDKKWFVSPKDFGCHCGKEACWITETGDFYPCIFFGDAFKVGNLREELFIDLWSKSKEKVKLCGNMMCNNCSVYMKCRGGCRARALSVYNDINAIDPLCLLKRNYKIKN